MKNSIEPSVFYFRKIFYTWERGATSGYGLRLFQRFEIGAGWIFGEHAWARIFTKRMVHDHGRKIEIHLWRLALGCGVLDRPRKRRLVA